ncbi:MAG: NTP transferase domain-containing protein [Candidatus Cloacimonetes bacterium]|nr:NTP transferase domain-containing protein [Candidatus Cloacimonadota bacterium]
MKKKTSVIILAAGKGVRMKSELPKVANKLAGTSLIERVVETFRRFSVQDIFVVVGHKKEIVKDCLSSFTNIKFALQEPQNGTGHAVMMAENFFSDFDGNVFVIPGDVPLLSSETLQNLENLHNKEDASATVLTAVLDDPAEYGRIVRNDENFVEKIVEFRDANEDEKRINEINSGIFCFKSEHLFSALKKIDNDNAQNELYLTDTLEILKNEGKKIAAMIVQNPMEISGVNSQEQLAFLENYIQKNN